MNTSSPSRTNGAGAAAILSAAIGSFCIGLFGTLADKSPAIKAHFLLVKASGPLSGQTTLAVALWLLTWVVLSAMWSKKSVSLGGIVTVSFILLTLGLLLTFPPFIDML